VEAYERRDEPVVEVSPICQRLREVRMAQGFMDEGLSLKQAARRLMVTAEHLRKQLGLLKLPEETLALIERDDPQIREMCARETLKQINRFERWQRTLETVDRAFGWAEELKMGATQAEIAQREGMTRARVCQLLKLSTLSAEQVEGLRTRRLLYGVSLSQVMARLVG